MFSILIIDWQDLEKRIWKIGHYVLGVVYIQALIGEWEIGMDNCVIIRIGVTEMRKTF